MDALQFLMTREITHMKAFTRRWRAWASRASRSAGYRRLRAWSTSTSTIRPAIGDRGEPDARGPWNSGGDWEIVDAPAFQQLQSSLQAAEFQPRPMAKRILEQSRPAKARKTEKGETVKTAARKANRRKVQGEKSNAGH